MALSLWLNSDTVHGNLAHIETEVQNNTGGALLDTSRLASEAERVSLYAAHGVEVAEQQLQQLEAKPADTLSATELAAAYELKGPVADSLDGLTLAQLAARAHSAAQGTNRPLQYVLLRHLEAALSTPDSGPRRIVDGMETGLPAAAPVGTVAADREAVRLVANRLEARIRGHWDSDTLENARAAARAELTTNRKLKVRAGRALSKLGVVQTSSTLTSYADF